MFDLEVAWVRESHLQGRKCPRRRRALQLQSVFELLCTERQACLRHTEKLKALANELRGRHNWHSSSGRPQVLVRCCGPSIQVLSSPSGDEIETGLRDCLRKSDDATTNWNGHELDPVLRAARPTKECKLSRRGSLRGALLDGERMRMMYNVGEATCIASWSQVRYSVESLRRCSGCVPPRVKYLIKVKVPQLDWQNCRTEGGSLAEEATLYPGAHVFLVESREAAWHCMVPLKELCS